MIDNNYLHLYLTTSGSIGAVAGFLFGGYTVLANDDVRFANSKFEKSILRTVQLVYRPIFGSILGAIAGMSSIVTLPVFTCYYIFGTYEENKECCVYHCKQESENEENEEN